MIPARRFVGIALMAALSACSLIPFVSDSRAGPAPQTEYFDPPKESQLEALCNRICRHAWQRPGEAPAEPNAPRVVVSDDFGPARASYRYDYHYRTIEGSMDPWQRVIYGLDEPTGTMWVLYINRQTPFLGYPSDVAPRFGTVTMTADGFVETYVSLPQGGANSATGAEYRKVVFEGDDRMRVEYSANGQADGPNDPEIWVGEKRGVE